MKHKKKIAIILSAMFAFTSVVAFAAKTTKLEEAMAYLNTNLKMIVMGKDFAPEEADGSRLYPITYKDRTYLPVRAIAEAMEATVDYDEAKNIVSIAKPTATPKPTKTPKPAATPKPAVTPRPTPKPTATPTAEPTMLPEKIAMTTDLASCSDTYWGYTRNPDLLSTTSKFEFTSGFFTLDNITPDITEKFKKSPIKINTKNKYQKLDCVIAVSGGESVYVTIKGLGVPNDGTYDSDAKTVDKLLYNKEIFAKSSIEIKDLDLNFCKTAEISFTTKSSNKIVVGDIKLQ